MVNTSIPQPQALASGFFELNRVLHNRMVELANDQERLEIPMSSLQIMMMIDSIGPVTISEISHSFSIAKPNVTPMIDRLAEKNYVRRDRDKGDKRIVHVALTDFGHKTIDELKNRIGSYLEMICNSFGADTSEHTQESLDAVLKILSAREA